MSDEKAKSLLRDMEAYKPYFDWELKTGELTTPQRRIVRAMRFGCFGEKKCYLTQRPIVPQLLHDAYDVHHLVKRGSPGCNLLINLRLALHGPNANAGKPRHTSGIRASVRKSLPDTDPTVMLRKVVDYSKGDASMQANGEAEPEFIFGLYHAAMKGPIPKQEAINGLAYLIGVSPATTRKYLDKQTSGEGPFMEQGNGSLKVITLKPEWKKKLKEEIEKP